MNALVLTLILVTQAVAAAGANVPSPAERRIDAARLVLDKQPNRYQAYNDLAMALARRARESGDAGYNQQAEQALVSSLHIQPQNFEGKQAHVYVLLGEHKYKQALAEAQVLNRATPDALLVWGYVAEADATLGDYDQAAKAAQWMMNLRPGNVPAYLCGAVLREDWGDLSGALEFLGKALQATPPLETEETAWILTAMARLNRISANLDEADSLLQQALKTFPAYHLALEESGRLRTEQKRYADAVTILEERNHNSSSIESRYLLAEALEHAGRKAQAGAAYAQFEGEARGRIDEADNDNQELVLYYAGRGHRPDEALRIARLEFARRHDVGTRDAYAWALYVNGQYEEARRQVEQAVAVGARDATLFSHAASIAGATGDKAAASRYLRMAAELDRTVAQPLLAVQDRKSGRIAARPRIAVPTAE